MGKREFNSDALSLKNTLLAQLLYRHFIALNIITSRHVFNIHISTSKVCILLGASQQIRYGEQWINTQVSNFRSLARPNIEVTLWQDTCDCTPAVLPHCSSQRDAYKA